MTYQRKTKDEYHVEVYYCSQYGWESEVVEDTYKEAQERKREYRENCNYPVRIVKRRVRL